MIENKRATTVLLLLLLSSSFGCATAQKKEAPQVRQEGTLLERLNHIPPYKRAQKAIEEGIRVLAQANVQVEITKQQRYYREAMRLFRQALADLEKSKAYLDEEDQQVVEHEIELVKQRILECLRDYPVVQREELR